jgi:hypothetical protein
MSYNSGGVGTLFTNHHRLKCHPLMIGLTLMGRFYVSCSINHLSRISLHKTGERGLSALADARKSILRSLLDRDSEPCSVLVELVCHTFTIPPPRASSEYSEHRGSFVPISAPVLVPIGFRTATPRPLLARDFLLNAVPHDSDNISRKSANTLHLGAINIRLVDLDFAVVPAGPQLFHQVRFQSAALAWYLNKNIDFRHANIMAQELDTRHAYSPSRRLCLIYVISSKQRLDCSMPSGL